MKSLLSPYHIERQRRSSSCAEVYLSSLREAASFIIFLRKISLPKRISQFAAHFTGGAIKSVLPANTRPYLSFPAGAIGDHYYSPRPVKLSCVIEGQELCQIL